MGIIGKDFDFAGQTIGHAGIDEYGGRSINNVKNIGQEAGYRGYGQQQQQPPQQQARPEMQSSKQDAALSLFLYSNYISWLIPMGRSVYVLRSGQDGP